MSNLTDEESRQRFEELFTEMFSESDRGCILIGASVLSVQSRMIANALFE
jgi:hypothetical protein